MKAKVLKNEQIAADAYKMSLAAPLIAKAAKPGQFIMAQCIDAYQPFLRRPFSIHKVTSQKSQVTSQVEVLYEVIGEGTNILSLKKPGEYLDIIGPLGNGFNYREPRTGNRKPILIAGGIGVAPLLFLAQKLKKRPAVLIGARTKKEILCEKEFKALGCEVKIATDDGSRGRKGFVTDLLKIFLREPKTENREPILYACGPNDMLKEVAKISKKYKIPAQVSLEEHMACGIGACLGCVVKTKNGLKRVCKEGPVFNTDEIIWQGVI